MNEGSPWECEVTEEDAGDRIDRHLGAALHPTYSRSYVSGLIKDGRVLVNGERCKPSYRLEPGDRVSAELGPPPSDSPIGEPLELDLLYEDEHLAVLNKPAGLVVHPSGSHQGGTLVNGLLARYPKIERVGVVPRPGIVHRLDKLTSGVMVVALSNPARLGLVDQFRERRVKKQYRAIVEGKVPLDSDYIDLPIGEHPKKHDRMRIDLRDGKSSSTYYEVVKRYESFTDLKVSPISGRTHQIRLHLSHQGHPVVADGTYAKDRQIAFRRLCEAREAEGLTAPRIHRQALHAARLAFTHPVDGRELSFEAPLPEDMGELLAILDGRA